MSRAIHGDLCQSEKDFIAIHLRSHAHLTNCIHMHCHSPMLRERSLMRDIFAIQRTESLRDPSTSPPLWLSPPIATASSKKHKRKCGVHRLGRSMDVDQEGVIGWPSTSAARVPRMATSKVAAAEAGNGIEVEGAESGKGMEVPEEKNKSHRGLLHHQVEARETKISCRNTTQQEMHLKTLLEHLEEVPSLTDSENKKISLIGQNSMHNKRDRAYEATGTSSHDNYNGLHKLGKQRLGVRELGAEDHNRVLSTSNFTPKASRHHKGYIGKGGEGTEGDISMHTRNGCGIHWNWSSIHHRGKTCLDITEKSLSCGISDSRLRKAEDTPPQAQRGAPTMRFAFRSSISLTDSDSESLPLLVEQSESNESTKNPSLARGSSGEVEVSRHVQDHGRGCETASDIQHIHGESLSGRHQSLTQKYVPRTFKDIVGQNLVVQALSNAILRRKVGSIYVFYGPHGTGKTSCARLFAKALNCQAIEQPKPCDACTSCISHNLGKGKSLLEIGPIGNFDLKSLTDFLDNMMSYQASSRYQVLIIDNCDSWSSDSWSTISKRSEQAPQRVVFVFVCSSLDDLPYVIISRCQKFFFPKLKVSDIMHTLQSISKNEGLAIDNHALKLIASRADGSLRDAEMTLDQLSLLGKIISLPVVQELVGLVPDDKVVDLLDWAFAADSVNTVKTVREIIETGVDPLTLMSQLATMITDILAGCYFFSQERVQRKFFCWTTISKADIDKLRQALRKLSEAEKQMRASNDKLTWLTSALLQLAPDQQYMLHVSPPSSKSDPCPTDIHEQQIPVFPMNNLNHADADNQIPSELTASRYDTTQINLKQEHAACERSPHSGTIFLKGRMTEGIDSTQSRWLPSDPLSIGRHEIMEILASPEKHEPFDPTSSITNFKEKGHQRAFVDATFSQRQKGKKGEQHQTQHLERSRVSLAQVIQQTEHQGRWSRHKPISIAEKLEQENLRLESRARNLCCWRSSRRTGRKVLRLRSRKRKSGPVLKLFMLRRCLCARWLRKPRGSVSNQKNMKAAKKRNL